MYNLNNKDYIYYLKLRDKKISHLLSLKIIKESNKRLNKYRINEHILLSVFIKDFNHKDLFDSFIESKLNHNNLDSHIFNNFQNEINNGKYQTKLIKWIT